MTLSHTVTRGTRGRARLLGALALALAVAVSGCAKSEDSGSGGSSTGTATTAPTGGDTGSAAGAAGATAGSDGAAAGSEGAAAGSGADSMAPSASDGDSSAAGGAAGGSQVVQGGDQGPTCTIEQYGLKPFDLKGATVGFSQSEKEDNPFRIAETASIKAEAAKLGIKLEATNAQTDLNKQISDIQDLLNKGVKLLIVAPLNSDGLEPAFQAAKDKGVPIITADRKVNMGACQDYVSFLGSNFVEQGKRAADQMIEATGGKGKVAVLLGAAGNNVTDDRTKGFVDQVKAKAPDLQIVAQQSGDFARDKGQQVTEQLIQSQPDLNGIYAENDEMGIGAVNALEAAGKKPGDAVKIVSVDGTKNAVQLIVDGKYNAVIESNPRFGPLAFQTAMAFAEGKPVGQNIVISDTEYTEANAKQKLAGAY